MYKHLKVLLLFFIAVGFVPGLTLTSFSSSDKLAKNYEDGVYRGVFIDSGGVEVTVQFTLKGNVVTDARYRLLQYAGVDYLKAEETTEKALARQYQQLLEYLQGKDIRMHVSDLYEPGKFVENVDGYSGATVRAGKIRSAVQDALNRGVYSY